MYVCLSYARMRENKRVFVFASCILRAKEKEASAARHFKAACAYQGESVISARLCRCHCLLLPTTGASFSRLVCKEETFTFFRESPKEISTRDYKGGLLMQTRVLVFAAHHCFHCLLLLAIRVLCYLLLLAIGVFLFLFSQRIDIFPRLVCQGGYSEVL